MRKINILIPTANRTEQNAGNKFSEVDPNSLNQQIKNLHQEIKQLESSTNLPPNLLNLKKEELRKLENKLNQKRLNNQEQNIQQKNNNSKLILGLGAGVLGLGLIGLIVYFLTKKKR